LAQDKTNDLISSSSDEAYENALNIYNDVIGRNSMIYTGGDYYYVHSGIKGHPFFIDNYWEYGTILYDGERYDSIQVKYDIFKDLLIVRHFGKDGYLVPIVLYSPKVKEFTLMDHHFIYILEDTLSDFKSGFFDLLYDGEKVKALSKRRKKEIKGQNIVTQLEKEYSLKDKYYIKSGDKYYPANSKSSVLKILSDRKSEVKMFIKKNKSRFRNNYERQLIEVAQYYDSILNASGS